LCPQGWSTADADTLTHLQAHMIQVSVPHFCAGLIHHNGRVANAAPILRYMINCGSRLPWQHSTNAATPGESPSRRQEVLSFKHHAEVAALPPAEADVLLDRAEA
jgi:hypothetical protein